jgi:putative hemolysin
MNMLMKQTYSIRRLPNSAVIHLMPACSDSLLFIHTQTAATWFPEVFLSELITNLRPLIHCRMLFSITRCTVFRCSNLSPWALLILANAFFVAAEFALVSIRETRIEQMLAAQVPGARAVRRLQQDLDDFLPAVQLGVTFCSLALGWMGEPLAPAFFGLVWRSAAYPGPCPGIYAHVAAVARWLCLHHLLSCGGRRTGAQVAGLAPGRGSCRGVAPPMLVFMALARPAVRLAQRLGRRHPARLRYSHDPEGTQVHSPEELKLIATAARRMGVLPKFQETLIHRALELDEVPIREIMTPRQKIFSLPSNMPIEEASARVIERKHSRVPVYDETAAPSTLSAWSTPRTWPG